MDPEPPNLPLLRFEAVPAARLAYLGSAYALNVLSGPLVRPRSTWLVHGEMIERPMLDPLGRIGYHAMSRGKRKNVPSKDGWGEMRIVAEDIGLEEMHYTLTDAGYYIPVPRKLIKEPLIRELNEKGTLAMRYEEPPPPGTTYTHWLF
jgi:hypothetical protein